MTCVKQQNSCRKSRDMVSLWGNDPSLEHIFTSPHEAGGLVKSKLEIFKSRENPKSIFEKHQERKKRALTSGNG